MPGQASAGSAEAAAAMVIGRLGQRCRALRANSRARCSSPRRRCHPTPNQQQATLGSSPASANLVSQAQEGFDHVLAGLAGPGAAVEKQLAHASALPLHLGSFAALAVAEDFQAQRGDTNRCSSKSSAPVLRSGNRTPAARIRRH